MVKFIKVLATKRRLLVTVGLMLVCQGAPAQKRYDFGYQINDARVQVFDDGFVTRIQIPSDMLIPTILAVEPRGEVLLQPRKESPYLVVDGVHSVLSLRWSGRADITARYAGDGQTRTLQAASFGAIAPKASYGAAAAPVQASVQGRVQPLADAQPMPPLPLAAKEWFIQPQDTWLSDALGAWAKQAGVALVWSLDEDYPLTSRQPRRYIGDFNQVLLAAISDVGSDLQAKFTGPYPPNPPMVTITKIRKGNQP